MNFLRMKVKISPRGGGGGGFIYLRQPIPLGLDGDIGGGQQRICLLEVAPCGLLELLK